MKKLMMMMKWNIFLVVYLKWKKTSNELNRTEIGMHNNNNNTKMRRVRIKSIMAFSAA